MVSVVQFVLSFLSACRIHSTFNIIILSQTKLPKPPLFLCELIIISDSLIMMFEGKVRWSLRSKNSSFDQLDMILRIRLRVWHNSILQYEECHSILTLFKLYV